MDKIYLLIGNDTPLAVCLRKSEGEETPVPYDLSEARHLRLTLVGHGMRVCAKDIEVSGDDNNVVSGMIPGRSLLKGDYDLEVTFNLDGRDKRFAVKDMFEAVDFLADDADGEAEGEGAGIHVTVTVQPELIEISGPTGPQGPQGETGPQGPQGPKGDTPVLTADSDGVIYSDGVMLTRVIKDTTDALTTRADSDHVRAESDHARAETDHTDITRARGDAETATSEANMASLRANGAADTAIAAAADATEAAGTIDAKIATKQDVIADLPQIREGASNNVKYTSQSLTDAQKTQARTNIAAASDSEVSQLRSEKADKDGYYPEMSVGSLKGTEVTQVEGITAIAKSTGLAKINEVMGRSLVWNQLVQNGDFSDGTTGWVPYGNTISVSDGVLYGTVIQAGSHSFCHATQGILLNHKYYIAFNISNTGSEALNITAAIGAGNITPQLISLSAGSSARVSYIKATTSAPNNSQLYIYTSGPNGVTWECRNIMLIDLTQLFGSGNEPSTVAEFESWLANNIGYRDYYAYNHGEIISNETEKLEITGLNQWDEEIEGGSISSGEPIGGANSFRFKNFMKVIPGASYSITKGGMNGSYYVTEYDSNKNFLISSSALTTTTFNVSQETSYIKLSFYKSGSDWGNVLPAFNICVNVSGSRDGEYEPYQKSELELNLATITGKLNGEGESVTIFPDGMGSVMDAYDRLIVDEDGWCRRAIRTVFSLDLGDLNWTYNKNDQGAFTNNGYASLFASGRNLCAKYTSPESARPASMPDKSIAINASPLLISGNFSGREIIIKDSSYTVPADLKASLTGVKLYYEGYPLEYVLDTPIQMTFQAKHGGVIRQLPENGSAPTTAPMRMSVTYALDAVSILTDLPENYVSKESLQAMLSAMQSAGLFSAYTMTFNESTGKYEFTFTANA